MSRFRDRTEDFKDSVRKAAVSIGYMSKVASTMASFIVHKPKERSPFTRAAFETLERIKELVQFWLKHRKDYVDLQRTAEQEKDSIEQEVELSNLLDGASQIETITVETSTLNHFMENLVLQQAQQTEFLYDQAVEATENLELGNKELSQAIQRSSSSSSRTFLLLFFFVLTFSFLFLDWYS